MQAWITAVHRWVGLALAAILLVVSVSGVLLLLRGPYYRWQHPSFGKPLTAAARARWPAVLDGIDARFGGEVRTIKLPQPGMHVFHVWLADGSEAFVDARSGTVIDRWHPTQRLPALLFDLHAHLLGGERGEVVNGVAAVLAIVFLGIGGGLVWWPRRAALPLRAVWPRTWAPGALLRSHAAVGAITVAPLLLFLVTGACMAFSTSVMPLLSRWLDATPSPVVRSTVDAGGIGRAAWHTRLERIDRAVAALPASPSESSRVVFLLPPRRPDAPLVARVRLPGEWHPNGRSLVVVDPRTADVLQIVDARAQGLGTRLGHAIYPVHAARIGATASWPLVLLALLAGTGLAVLSLTGVVTWGQRVARARTRRVPSSSLAIVHELARRRDVGDGHLTPLPGNATRAATRRGGTRARRLRVRDRRG